MDTGEWPNLVGLFLNQVEKHGDRPFLWEKREGAYRPMSWREAAGEVALLAAALRRYGVREGDRVLLLSHNSPRWAIADFAIMAAGGVTTPVYTTNTPRDHAHIIADSGATVAVISTAALARPFFEAGRACSAMTRVIVMEDLAETDTGEASVVRWEDALTAGAGDGHAIVEAARAADPNALACLIYTSGTGGAPKGVMLSHRAIIANCIGAKEVLDELGLDDEVFLSFLPLSHAYEHTAGLMFPVFLGAQIYFAERIDTLAANLPEARPTIMTAVPRLYEIMRGRMIHGIRRESRLRQKLFWTTVELGRKRYENPAAMTARERFVDALVERLVRNKVRARFGGRLKALVSGGAPLNYDVGTFFAALGMRLLQGYGQTEAAPVISCNRCSRIKLHTVGPALKHVEVCIADDGEILVRGPLLMDGYWKLPELSAETLRGGWLHTGDVGHLDEDGYLQITDRKKDIIVTSAGDTLSPQRIESVLALEPEIDAAMAVGDNRPHVVAIVVPAQEFVEEWAGKNGDSADLSKLVGNSTFRSAIAHAIDRANESLSTVERVKRFVVADQPFTIENGMMTPTMKPRRHAILERWGDSIERLYQH